MIILQGTQAKKKILIDCAVINWEMGILKQGGCNPYIICRGKGHNNDTRTREQRSITKLLLRFENRETLQIRCIGRPEKGRRLTARRGGDKAHA